VVKYFSDWNLKCNLKKMEILVSKRWKQQQKKGRWFLNDTLKIVEDEIHYLGATLESAGDGICIITSKQ
jgi:hypothetical protein